MKKIARIFICFILASCTSEDSNTNWQLGPFSKLNTENPILHPLGTTLFDCPILEESIAWEVKDVFNPTALVRDDTLIMLYRAEDTLGIYNGTSRIGLAWSTDGVNFTRKPTPIFYPDHDENYKYEWEGGNEDPRIVGHEGGYVMTYTSYDGELARLCVATTTDLLEWKKYGPAFDKNLWSKSGAIVADYTTGTPEAKKINGTYWMYWGDTDIYLATSDDLIHWDPYTDSDGEIIPILSPREGMFDSRLVEPGPAAMFTEHGIRLIYNGMNYSIEEGGNPELAEGTYSGGQALFDLKDPSKMIERTSHYFITPEQPYEITGQIGNVCFVEGLVKYKEKWFLYYGTADSKIAVATASSNSVYE